MNTTTSYPVRGAQSARSNPAAATRRVTDAPTRMFHLLLALSFAGAYLSAESEKWRLLHVTLGYAMAGLLAARLLYGVLGPRSMALGLMGRKVAGLPQWLKTTWAALKVWAAQPDRGWPALSASHWRQAQNLAMATAALGLLALVVPITLTGYATYNDWGDGWGGELWSELHEASSEAMLMLVLAHIGLVLLTSLLRRHNQALPMLTGRMPGPGPDLVAHNRVALAVGLLLTVLTWVVWSLLGGAP